MKSKINHTYNKREVIVLDSHYSFLKDSGNDMARILNTFKYGCVIIGAMRSEYDDKENLMRSNQLENDLRALGLGYRPSIGGFVENKDTDNEAEVEELSFIVPYYKDRMSEQEFYNEMLKLCKKYEQESILVSLPSVNGGKACYINSDGEIDMSFNKIGMPKNPTYYTKPIKHNTPKFEFADSEENYEFIQIPEIDLEEVARYYGQHSIYLNPNSAEPRKYDNGWRK